MTSEQRKVLARADAAHGLIGDGRGRYRVSHPWKAGEPEGPTTHTAGTFTYTQARQVRARYVAFCALVLSGVDQDEADMLTDEKTGRAIDIFTNALKSLETARFTARGSSRQSASGRRAGRCCGAPEPSWSPT